MRGCDQPVVSTGSDQPGPSVERLSARCLPAGHLCEQLATLLRVLVLDEHLVAAYPISAQISPNTAPNSAVDKITLSAPSSVKIAKMRPMNRPSQRPDSTPPSAILPVVRRPVTRSTCFRSVPTIMQFSTGNSWSDR